MRRRVGGQVMSREGSDIPPSFSSAGARWLIAVAAVAVTCGLLGRARDSALERASRLEAEVTRLDELAAAYLQLASPPAAPGPRSSGSGAAGPAPIPVRAIVERATREALQQGKVLSLAGETTEPRNQPGPATDAAGIAPEERVELRLSGAPLVDLVDLLYKLERGPQPLRVHRLHVRRSVSERSEAALDVMAVLEAPRPGR